MLTFTRICFATRSRGCLAELLELVDAIGNGLVGPSQKPLGSPQVGGQVLNGRFDVTLVDSIKDFLMFGDEFLRIGTPYA